MNKLYKMSCCCGRMGSIDGLFISDQDPVGLSCSFGEALGKHSDVNGVIDEGDITLVSEDQEKVLWLLELCGNSVSGYNPFEYADEETCEECGEIEDYCECDEGFQV